VGLEYTGYAHQVLIGNTCLGATVAHTKHQNYDRIEVVPIDRYYSEYRGVGPRKPHLTPHPDAQLIAAAPELYAAVQALLYQEPDAQNIALAALAKAEGRNA
jgi:hypothetical protein